MDSDSDDKFSVIDHNDKNKRKCNLIAIIIFGNDNDDEKDQNKFNCQMKTNHRTHERVIRLDKDSGDDNFL